MTINNEKGGTVSESVNQAFGPGMSQPNKRIPLVCQFAFSRFDRLKGLLFKTDFDNILVLAPCNDIHTLGMRSAIDVAFIDTNGMVVESCRKLKPFSRMHTKEAVAVLERFSKETPWFSKGDQIELVWVSKERPRDGRVVY